MLELTAQECQQPRTIPAQVRRLYTSMDFFRPHHPEDLTVLCDRKGCEQVADYLEVHDHAKNTDCAPDPPISPSTLLCWPSFSCWRWLRFGS